MLLNRNIKVPNKNSLYHLMLGLVFLGTAAWIIYQGMQKESGVDQFDWIYVASFCVVGIYFSVKGLNYIFRKAYIRVDEEKIAVKPDEETKSETIFWRDIQSIKEVGRNFEILKNDKTSYTIHFSYYTYRNADDLREAILEMADKKGVKVERNNIIPKI